MEWKLELVPIPVTDVDRAKYFYAEQLGFAVDHDTGMPRRLCLDDRVLTARRWNAPRQAGEKPRAEWS
ncbi:hypothetical protein GCM10012275_26800 [Longimycelium tulufanense]|uniref:Glyoxalase/Bleomycin resistance-like N-terminal domain-containing protein n=1 Tax=Longimycelium tulufanense TaxID=907463 RepID=A0A8J3CED3_9PSEU|nr:hypothetical protein [Longimycelium tulufanense]GGM54303.1 hypothetical protein GCM10012275_26800 [Longimycelium tulufanense]